MKNLQVSMAIILLLSITTYASSSDENITRMNGDYYADQFNLYLNKAIATGIQTSVNLPLYAYGTKLFVVRDTLGELAGYMYEGYNIVDTTRMDTALYWIKEGISNCPDRLDLYFGLATCCLWSDDSDEMLTVLEKVMLQEKKNNRKWLWTKDEQIPDTIDYVFERIQEDYERFLNAEMMEHAENLVSMAIKYFPEREEYMNDMAVIYYIRQDFNEALKYFKKALEINPNDELIKANINKVEQVINEQQNH
ncbi:MAG: tetratricopeptide repeat protein [Salinivirgaceae bacterium]|nr:tetratricopeptide repeat protein [Salinivirgaceae bacterium]